jgi:hypothetical protein
MRSPEELGASEIRAFLLHQIEVGFRQRSLPKAVGQLRYWSSFESGRSGASV